MTKDTLEEIRTIVFTVAIGTLSFDAQYSKSPGGAAILKKCMQKINHQRALPQKLKISKFPALN